MQSKRRLFTAAVVAGGLATLGASAGARAHGPAACGPGRGMMDGDHHADMMGFHYLFAHRDQIRRSVEQIPGGVRTLTESDDPEVATQIRAHVRAMYERMKTGRPINARDPLFAELFRNAAKVKAVIEDTPHGVRVTETSADAAVTRLIRAHAEVVNQFLANGPPEMMRTHEPPP